MPKDLVDKMNFAKEIYQTELEYHFRDEEELVFLYLKEKDKELDELISEILNEHIILKEKILSINDNPNLVDEHIRKKERILFEKFQMILNADELKIIENKFDESRPQYKSCFTK